jgi:uridylate kinase
MPRVPKFRRVLLKLSGEALRGQTSASFDFETITRLANEIRAVRDMEVQVCVVIGGGNIVRGEMVAALGLERTNADYMGMLATVINSLALQNVLESIGVEARVLSAFPVVPACETYDRRRAVEHLVAGRVVIFAGGTGNPFFSTDTAAALRAVEMRCGALVKGTQVDGVYASDPRTNPAAERFEHLDYQEVLARNLRVMDASAVALARDNKVPILVFSIHNRGAFADVVAGKGVYTTIG